MLFFGNVIFFRFYINQTRLSILVVESLYYILTMLCYVTNKMLLFTGICLE